MPGITMTSAARPRRAIVAALVGLVALFALSAGRAHADSRFIYELCDSQVPGGAVPASSYTVNPGVPFVAFQNCASPGGMIGITETGPASATFSYLGIAVPETPGGFVEQEALVAGSSGLAPANYYSHVYENGFPGINTESSRIAYIRKEKTPFFGSGGSFNIVMSCDGNYTAGCQAGPVIGVRDIAATEVDIKPPTVSEITGSILAGGVIRGHSQSLSAVAQDEGGGLSKVWIAINGSVAAEAPPPSCATASVSNTSVVGTVALSTTPCPTKLPATWTLNTETFPFQTGANTVSVCASDFATIGAPNTTCSAPQEIDVDNTCAESPVVGGDQLTAQFKSSETDSVTVKYNHAAKVRGSLLSAAGTPVPGATLCVKESVLNTFHRVKGEGVLTTDSKGHYSYEIKGGPNRELLIGYRHDAAQIADSLHYLAHARPTLRASTQKLRNGEKVKFLGQLPGPNAVERTAILQASAPGSHRWLTIRKAVSGKGGFIITGYRFSNTTTATTYLFRLVAPRQKNYAWEEGASKPVRIRVTPRRDSHRHHHPAARHS